jgi:hypothetical protein
MVTKFQPHCNDGVEQKPSANRYFPFAVFPNLPTSGFADKFGSAGTSPSQFSLAPCPSSPVPFLSIALLRFRPILNLQPINVLKVLVACDEDETISQSNRCYPNVIDWDGFAFAAQLDKDASIPLCNF